MDNSAKLEDIRKRIARRAAGLTGVSKDEILRELGRATVDQDSRPDGRNWSIENLAVSRQVAEAIDQAIRDVAEDLPNVEG